ncbi:MAG: HAD family hydrolase [Ottowia sp.]|nr:HAD-IB family hydrolase [Ottowia sp.]
MPPRWWPEIEVVQQLALFDLDHTLIPLDSDHAWGEFTIALGWADAQAFRRCNDAFYAQYQAGTLDIAEYVRFATAALRTLDPADAEAGRARFMAEVIEPAIHAQALELVAGHQRRGDAVAVVTATSEWVTRPIADRFGVADLIAMRLQLDAAGRPTGAIAGVPSFGAGKVTRVGQWLAARELGWRDVHVTFYSDSFNDLPLLEHVQQPVATNPDAQLRRIARQRDWTVLDLFKDQDS